MNKQVITRDKLAYAAGLDAGNAQMRAAGRTRWNEDDLIAASNEYHRVNPHQDNKDRKEETP